MCASVHSRRDLIPYRQAIAEHHKLCIIDALSKVLILLPYCKKMIALLRRCLPKCVGKLWSFTNLLICVGQLTLYWPCWITFRVLWDKGGKLLMKQIARLQHWCDSSCHSFTPNIIICITSRIRFARKVLQKLRIMHHMGHCITYHYQLNTVTCSRGSTCVFIVLYQIIF